MGERVWGERGPEIVRLQLEALEITREMFQADKPVAAICHGPQILVSADLVRGRKATCWKGIRDDLMSSDKRNR